ncbi:MAG: hypothetical protein OEZ01_14390 [Candidatus Heimdallarchaeota archaeon]|nr:hypothetical protein [Candidatus Heimdallarchaeota archaeon]
MAVFQIWDERPSKIGADKTNFDMIFFAVISKGLFLEDFILRQPQRNNGYARTGCFAALPLAPLSLRPALGKCALSPVRF